MLPILSIQIYNEKVDFMFVGNRIHLFKNLNLKKKGYPSQSGGLKPRDWLEDPSKGNVFKKYDGVIVKIYESGETIPYLDILKFSRGNEMVKKSLEAHRSRVLRRYMCEFKDTSPFYRYRILSEGFFSKKNVNNVFGYAVMLPNSIQFIMED